MAKAAVFNGARAAGASQTLLRQTLARFDSNFDETETGENRLTR